MAAVRLRSIFLALLSLASIAFTIPAFGQSEWAVVESPLSNKQLCVVNDSVLFMQNVMPNGALFMQSETLYQTVDRGRTWLKRGVANSTVHFDSPSRGFQYTSQVLDQLHQTFNDVFSTSVDSGKTWKASTTMEFSRLLFLVRRNPRSWYYGHAPYSGGSPIGFSDVFDGQTGRSVFNSSPGYVLVNSIAFDNDTGLFYGGPSFGKKGLWQSQNRGASWKFQDSTKSENAVVYSLGYGTWMLSYSDSLLVSWNGCRTWQRVLSGVPIQDLDCSYDGTCLLTRGNADYVLRSSDYGKSWSPRTLPIPSTGQIQVLDSLHAWLTGDGNQLLHTSTGGGKNAPVLSVARTVNFGVVDTNVPLAKAISIVNVSDSEIVITKTSSTHQDFKISPNSLIIPPRDTASVIITFTAHSLKSERGTVTLQSNTTIGTESIQVTGTGYGVILSTVDSLDFGPRDVGELQRRHIRLYNTGEQIARKLSASSSNSDFRLVKFATDSIQRQASVVVEIEFLPHASGESTGFLSLSSVDGARDTILLRGEGRTKSNLLAPAWKRSYRTGFSRTSESGWDLIQFDQNVIAGGLLVSGNGVLQPTLLRLGGSGIPISSFPVPIISASPPSELSLSVSQKGVYILAKPLLYHLWRDGSLTWIDTLLGMDNTPHQMIEYPDGRMTLMSSGYQTSLDYQQIGLFDYNEEKGRLKTSFVNGNSHHYPSGAQESHNGKDFGVQIALDSSERLFGWFVEDEQYFDKGLNFDLWDKLLKVYPDRSTSEVYAVHATGRLQALSIVNRSQPAIIMTDGDSLIAIIFDSVLYRSKATRLKVPKPSGLISVSYLKDSGAISSYTVQSELSGKDVAILRWRADGSMAWKQQYNGGLDIDDTLVQFITDSNANSYALIASRETTGLDWVVMSYDSSGVERFRLRVDGDSHVDDIPRRMLLTDLGLFITGSTTDTIGRTEFTVARFLIPGSIENKIETPRHVVSSTKLSAYPQPWTADLELSLGELTSDHTAILVNDMLGRVISQSVASSKEVNVSRGGLPSAVYFIEAISATGQRGYLRVVAP